LIWSFLGITRVSDWNRIGGSGIQGIFGGCCVIESWIVDPLPLGRVSLKGSFNLF
jgi:hypothetical protein